MTTLIRYLPLLLLAILTFKNPLFSEEKTMTAQPTVTIETTQGTIVIRMMCDIAPKACENFMTHAEKGYYNDVTFHRVIKGFMLQGGDPKGNGTGGESIWGAPFEDEFSPKVNFDRPGLLAMANRGPKTNGSQFFITVAATPWLNNKHTIFGEVIEGMPVVQKIENVPTDGGNKPLTPVKILKITVNQPSGK